PGGRRAAGASPRGARGGRDAAEAPVGPGRAGRAAVAPPPPAAEPRGAAPWGAVPAGRRRGAPPPGGSRGRPRPADHGGRARPATGPARCSVGGGGLVGVDDLTGRAVHHQLAPLQPDGAVAGAPDGLVAVADQEDGAGPLPQLLDPLLRAPAERAVAGGQGLVDEQHVVVAGG